MKPSHPAAVNTAAMAIQAVDRTDLSAHADGSRDPVLTTRTRPAGEAPLKRVPAFAGMSGLLEPGSMTALSHHKSDLVRTLVARGYLHQCTDLERLDAKAVEGVVTGYIGFDATASSLHVGSLVQIMMLRRMQQAGHRPIVVMGGGTTKVGDPSGKDAARQMLDDAGIAANMASLKRAFEPFLRFGDGATDAITVDNDDVALRLRLRGVPARVRAALHHQPHAELRLREAAAGARAAAELPRVQLHADAGGGLPGVAPPPRLRSAARRLATSGATSSTGWS